MMYTPAYAQEEVVEEGPSECETKLSMYFEYYKAKNFKDAYPEWLYLYKNCADLQPIHFQYGAKMIESFIPEAVKTDAAKADEYKKLLMEVYNTSLERFPDYRPGYTKGLKAQAMLRFRIGTPQEAIALIKEVLRLCPTASQTKEMLSDIELDINDFFKFYSKAQIEDAVLYAKDLKDRFTVLWLNFDFFGTNEPLFD